MQNNNDNPYFAYIPLGAVHEPHLPPDKYINGSNVAGEYATPHMDMLLEMDKTVGSLVGLIEDKGLAEDTIIISGSDNGGLNPTFHPIQGKTVVVNLGIIQAVGYEAHSTVCDLIGVDVPKHSAQDSISFADYLIPGTYSTSSHRKPWRCLNMRVTVTTHHTGNRRVTHFVMDNSSSLIILKSQPLNFTT